jgi:hypothetical protein
VWFAFRKSSSRIQPFRVEYGLIYRLWAPLGGKTVKASLLYKIASGLLVLLFVGHTLGFRQGDPQWGVGSLVEAMRTFYFDAQGFRRTYWDFYVGFGLLVSVFFLFTAVLAWQLGSMSQEALVRMPVVTWALAISFVGVTVLNWRYFFLVPIIFSSAITLCLLLAAWLSKKSN